MKISVIGGSGFIGTRFCQLLAEDKIAFEIIDLKISHRFPAQSKTGDVRDIRSLRSTITGNIVVNLAAVHRDDVRDPSEYLRTNVLGSENVALICSEKFIKTILFTSSVAVYGPSQTYIAEGSQAAPANEYGRSKYLAEEVLIRWQNADKTRRLIIVRPTVVFGEGNRGNVFNLLNSIASGRFIMIGDGNNKKSIAYVGNLAFFLKVCLATDKDCYLVNYVDKPDMDMNTLVMQVRKVLTGRTSVGPRIPIWLGLFIGYSADVVTRLTGRRLPISSIRVRKFCSSSIFESSAHELSNFSPPFSIMEGLSRTLTAEFIYPDPEREIFVTE